MTTRREQIARIIEDASGDIYWAVELARPFDYEALADAILALEPKGEGE